MVFLNEVNEFGSVFLKLLKFTIIVIIIVFGVDGKNSDKANAIRSKHSVTEQRRRSKINERYQFLIFRDVCACI